MTNEDSNKDEPQILPFKTLSGLELMNTAPEQIPSLVDGMFLQVGVSQVSAKPKCGKSSWARQAAVCVADGKDFMGRTTLCGDVLYLILEGPLGVAQQHFKKLGFSGQRGSIHVVYEKMPYKGELGLARLVETIKRIPNLRLVVVDPVSKLLRLMDSFNPDEVLLGIEKLEQIAKDHNLHLMFLTHLKKRVNEDDVFDGSMGSTSFRGGTDTNVHLCKQGQQRIITTEQRWGTELEPTFLNWNEATLTSELGETVEAQEQKNHEHKERSTLNRIEQEIMAALDGKSLTQGELLTAVTGKNVTIIRVLEELVGAGKVQSKVDGKALRYSYGALPVEQHGTRRVTFEQWQKSMGKQQVAA
jgi:RecA-family ATPase